MQIRGVYHRIDDQRADIGDARRQDAGDSVRAASVIESGLFVVQTSSKARRL